MKPVESETTFFRDPNTDATLVGARGKAAAAVSSFSKCGRPSPPEALRGSSSSTERASKKKQRGIRREGPRGINGTLPSDALSNRDRVETLLLTVEALKVSSYSPVAAVNPCPASRYYSCGIFWDTTNP